MNKTKKSPARAILALAALIIVAAGLFFVYDANKPAPAVGAKAVTVSVVSPEGEQTFTYQTDAEFLREMLCEELGATDGEDEPRLMGVEGEDSQYGLFITSVNGYAANADNQEWWCLTANGGEMVMTGVDETPLADGSVFELVLTIGW